MNRKAEMERLQHSVKRKYSYYYGGTRRNPLIPVMPTGHGHNNVPVSDLLALFGNSAVAGETEKSEVNDGPTLTKTRF